MTFEVTEHIPEVPAGTYPAVITDIQVKASKADGSEFRVWTFTLADGSGRTITGASSMQSTPKSKAGKWVAAIIGRVPTVGEKIELVGRHCVISVEINDDGYEKVTGVMAPITAPPAPRPALDTASPVTTPAGDGGIEDDTLPF